MPSGKATAHLTPCKCAHVCGAHGWRVGETPQNAKGRLAQGKVRRVWGVGGGGVELCSYLPLFFPYVLEHTFLRVNWYPLVADEMVLKGPLNVLNHSFASERSFWLSF